MQRADFRPCLLDDLAVLIDFQIAQCAPGLFLQIEPDFELHVLTPPLNRGTPAGAVSSFNDENDNEARHDVGRNWTEGAGRRCQD